MTNEEMHRTMEFILEQQAQFAASMQRMEEGFRRSEEERIRDQPRLARVEESFVVLVQLAENLDSRLDESDSRLDEVDAINTDHESRIARVEESFVLLTKLALKSDSRLDSLEATTSDLDKS